MCNYNCCFTFCQSFQGFLYFRSVSLSNEEVASSNKIIELFFNMALAIDNLCFSPPDNPTPSSPTKVSNLFGRLFINFANDNLATYKFPHHQHFCIFDIIFDSVVKKVAWLTIEISCLIDFIVLL